MGKAKELYTELQEKEWINLDMTMKAFVRIREQLDSEEYFVKTVEPKDFDYSFDKGWKAKSKEAKTAYRELKDIEYEIRMKIREDAKKESAERNG